MMSPAKSALIFSIWLAFTPKVGDEQAFGGALRHVKEAGLIPEDQVRLCAIADGAPWTWKRVEELFPSSRQILAEHLETFLQ